MYVKLNNGKLYSVDLRSGYVWSSFTRQGKGMGFVGRSHNVERFVKIGSPTHKHVLEVAARIQARKAAEAAK